MAWMRARLLMLLLFSLISLGQAYPFSYAYALGQEDSCACRRSGHECGHGCLRKGHGCCHHGSGIIGHSEDRGPGVATMPCGGKTRQEILSFRGDPFLPAAPVVIPPPRRRSARLESEPHVVSWLRTPDTPPPRPLLAA